MLSTILHVEDDATLRALVDMAFENFGFRGQTVSADSVAQARERLDAAARAHRPVDLIISDMNLPDGSGLDVVRYVRASTAWKATPVLILSGDVDPKKVGKAYALGANAYLDKSPRGRTMSEVLRSLYQHWGEDAVLPSAPAPAPAPATAPAPAPAPAGERVQRLLAQAMSLRRRHAELYQRLAEAFEHSRADAAFWLSRALAESNLINLLGFLQHQLHDHELPDGAAADLERMQTDVDRLLTAGERELARGPITPDAAYRLVIDLVMAANLYVLSKGIGHLFPSKVTAMEAVHDFLVCTVNDVAAWVDLHAIDPVLRERAARMRTQLDTLTAQHA